MRKAQRAIGQCFKKISRLNEMGCSFMMFSSENLIRLHCNIMIIGFFLLQKALIVKKLNLQKNWFQIMYKNILSQFFFLPNLKKIQFFVQNHLIQALIFYFICNMVEQANQEIYKHFYMKNSKILIKDQTTEFIEKITHELNSFFNKISKQGYSFECIHTPNQNDDKAIQIKKAYRIFKKFLINQKLIDPELGQKARQRFASRVWQQLNEAQKLKYFTPKHFPPLHYLQKLVANVAQKRHSKSHSGQNNDRNRNQILKAAQQQAVHQSSILNQQQTVTQNKKMDKKSEKQPSNVVIIQ